MRANALSSVKSNILKEDTSSLTLVVLLGVGVPLGIWSAIVLFGDSGSESVAFDAAVGWFVLLAIVYLVLHGLKGLAWCSVPVLLTFRALLEFVVMPTWRFAAGDDAVDSTYVHAMFLIVIGFGAFWVGSLVVMKKTELRFVPHIGNTPNRVTWVSLVMLGLGFCGGVVLWQAGLYSYT